MYNFSVLKVECVDAIAPAVAEPFIGKAGIANVVYEIKTCVLDFIDQFAVRRVLVNCFGSFGLLFYRLKIRQDGQLAYVLFLHTYYLNFNITST